MPTPSSEYSFPVFISSTVYNLIDLREELSRYLASLGYKPILSSADGFHDNSPTLAPWESCLKVLETTFVMVLIIDGRYGAGFEWKNFQSIIGDRKVSPTHAEYLFAHDKKIRMLVFIRKEILTHYQSFRTALHKAGNDRKIAKENLSKTLPAGIEFEALEFIQEVKTKTPIPWIKPFETVIDIKREVKKKMLNELAEVFLFRNKHLETVIATFSSSLVGLPEEQQSEILDQVVTGELKERFKNNANLIKGHKDEMDVLFKEREQMVITLEKAKKESEENFVLKEKYNTVTKELEILQNRVREKEAANVTILSGDNAWLADGWVDRVGARYSSPAGSVASYLNTPVPIILGGIGQRCEGCGNPSIVGPLKICKNCGRSLCNRCFDGGPQVLLNTRLICSDCINRNTE